MPYDQKGLLHDAAAPATVGLRLHLYQRASLESGEQTCTTDLDCPLADVNRGVESRTYPEFQPLELLCDFGPAVLTRLGKELQQLDSALEKLSIGAVRSRGSL